MKKNKSRKQKVESRKQAARARACRVCGCTETSACTTPSGPCRWAEPDLCSACLANEPIPSGVLITLLRFAPSAVVRWHIAKVAKEMAIRWMDFETATALRARQQLYQKQTEEGL